MGAVASAVGYPERVKQGRSRAATRRTILALLFIYPLLGAPTGFAATLVMTAMIARRAGVFGEIERVDANAPRKLPQLQT